MTGINDLGDCCRLAILPSGDLFVKDCNHNRFVSVENGYGRVVFDDSFVAEDVYGFACSPAGVLYVLPEQGRVVQKLVGASFQTVIAAETLPEDLRFCANEMFVTMQEMIYLVDDNTSKGRILRIDPAEPLKPVVVGQVPKEDSPDLWSIFVTEAGTIYVTDDRQRKVLAFRPGSTDPIEVLQRPGDLLPLAVLVHGSSMYVSMADDRDSLSTGGIYEYALPPELQLE